MAGSDRIIDDRIFDGFSRISLEDMGKVKLMNRVDTKFVANIRQLKALLQRMESEYYIQDIENQLNMPYYTRYFDTAELDMFYQHQRGKKVRQKIRLRLYEGSMDLPFLEVKSKNNKGRTSKKRILMEDGENLAFYDEFLDKHAFYPFTVLLPAIENHFYRMTLVNRDMTERVTIDTELSFHNPLTRLDKEFPDLCIVEWKKDGRVLNSFLERNLRDLHIHQMGFSKYCIGVATTTELLRLNRLKQKLRMVDKIRKGLR